MFVAALPELRAERQLQAIEAAVVPHMKPDDARRVMERHRQAAQPPKPRKPAAMALLDGFRSHGLAVVEQPVAKPSA